jgi:hypothetical protein
MFKLKLSSAATDDGSVAVSRRTWIWWIVGTLATLPASASLWFVGAMSAGGGEDYDPPAPGIVDPGIPGVWVAIALVPTWLALGGGFLAIRREWGGLFVFSLTAPYVVALLGVFAILAID